MKREFSELSHQIERRINHLLRIGFEQKSAPDLFRRISPALEQLHSDHLSLQSHLDSVSSRDRELSRLIKEIRGAIQSLENVSAPDLESRRRSLVREKRLLQQLRNFLETNWQEPLRVKILGIGEITTTIELQGPGAPRRRKPEDQTWVGLAIKKAPGFPDRESAGKYSSLCYEYEDFLSRNLGIKTPYAEHRLIAEKDGRWLVYNFQERLPGESIACLIIQVADLETIEEIFSRLLSEMKKLFLWNRSHPEYLIGFDGQIPNWSFPRFGPGHPALDKDEPLFYLDTTTPLIRRDGKEQLDTEIFIKSIPLFLRPIIRRTLLKEVLDRYYRPRDVILDLLASLLTHHRPDLLAGMVELVNQWLEQNLSELPLKPYTAKEIVGYNRQDVWIWKFFRQMKRVDRLITEKIMGKTYGQRLPKGSPDQWENLVGAGGKGLTIPESLKGFLKKHKGV